MALSATLCFKKRAGGAIRRYLLRELRLKAGALFLLGQTKFLSRGFYGRAESPPVFEHGVWKEGRHPSQRRTLALDVKSLRDMTNFFAQLFFSAPRSFASALQIS